MNAIRSPYSRPSAAFFLLGFVLQSFLASRSWIGGDQVHLLNLGLDFSVHHHLQPFAKMMSGAGANPGVLLQLLVGIPLALVPHYHSPMLVILGFHCCAGLLFFLVMRQALGPRAGFFSVIVYWLSPWRLYNGGFLWEPAFIFLPAAAHFWASWKLRDRADWFPSAILLCSLVAAVQLHNSAFVLILLTVFLYVRKLIWINLKGAALGVLVASLTLAPTAISAIQGNLPVAQASEGFLGQSLLRVYPVFKGMLYWFTLGALDMVRQLNETSYVAGGTLLPVFSIRALQLLCILSVGVSIAASWWYFRPLWGKEEDGSQQTNWLRSYALYSCVTLVIAAALSPIVLQGWMVVVALHAACIPVIAWADGYWFRPEGKRTVWMSVAPYVCLQCGIIVVLALGLYIFNPSGQVPAGVDSAKNADLMKIIP